jgi:hypothetical protein
LHCGDSLPLLWLDRAQGALLGYLDNKTEVAHFSHDKVAEQVTGKALDDMMIIVRELKGGNFLYCLRSLIFSLFSSTNL